MAFPTGSTPGDQYEVGGLTYEWNGYAWDLVTGPVIGTAVNDVEFVATEGQTVFTTDYSVGFLDVLRQGIELADADYVADNGTSVVLAVGANVGDVVTVKKYDTFSVADAYTKAEVDAKGALKINTTEIGISVQGYDANIVSDSGYVATEESYTTTEKTKLGTVASNAQVNTVEDTEVIMTKLVLTATGEGGTTVLSPDTSLFYSITADAALTFTFNGFESNKLEQVVVELVNGGAFAMTFTGVTWVLLDGTFGSVLGDTGLALQASGTDYLLFFSPDGGTTIRGKLLR